MLSEQFKQFSEQTNEAFAGESVFGIVTGGWMGQLKFFKRSSTKTYFW